MTFSAGAPNQHAHFDRLTSLIAQSSPLALTNMFVMMTRTRPFQKQLAYDRCPITTCFRLVQKSGQPNCTAQLQLIVETSEILIAPPII